MGRQLFNTILTALWGAGLVVGIMMLTGKPIVVEDRGFGVILVVLALMGFIIAAITFFSENWDLEK